MLTAVVLASLIVAGDPDGVVSTAPKGTGAVVVGAVAPTSDAQPDAAQAGRVTTQDLTTAEQIDRWISAPGRDVAPFAVSMGPGDDRRMHGFVSGSIGTDDFSSVSVGVSLPIGETGRLDLSYSQTKNGWGFGYPGYGYGYGGSGYGYGYPDAVFGRPFGVIDPFYGAGYGHGAGVRSGRSVALGLGWGDDKDKDRRERMSVED